MDIYPIAVLLYAILIISTLLSLKATMQQIMREERSQNGGKNQQLVDKISNKDEVKK